MGYIFVFQALEATYFWYITKTILPKMLSDGQNLNEETISEFILLSILLVHVWRLWLVSNRMLGKYQILVFFVSSGGYLISLLIRSQFGFKKASHLYMLMTHSPNIAYTCVLCLSIPLFAQYVAINGVKNNLFNPLLKVLLDKYKSREYKFFSAGKNLKRYAYLTLISSDKSLIE